MLYCLQLLDFFIVNIVSCFFVLITWEFFGLIILIIKQGVEITLPPLIAFWISLADILEKLFRRSPAVQPLEEFSGIGRALFHGINWID